MLERLEVVLRSCVGESALNGNRVIIIIIIIISHSVVLHITARVILFYKNSHEFPIFHNAVGIPW